jgi:hypothetical protein
MFVPLYSGVFQPALPHGDAPKDLHGKTESEVETQAASAATRLSVGMDSTGFSR